MNYTDTDRIEALEAEVGRLAAENTHLKADALTMALRLLGEDPDTFSPETYEVMQRWGKVAMSVVEGK